MPIVERDAWRQQYFVDVRCPPHIEIPTDDVEAWRLYPTHRWVYNKLLIAESQELACGPHGVEPSRYPVFGKPIYNLQGMGVDSGILRDRREYLAHLKPGHMWMQLLEGPHVSTDVAVVDGHMRWSRHTMGQPLPGGTFDYWIVEHDVRPALEAYLKAWIAKHLPNYTGMINFETIDGRIIEMHLRFSDQWPDLYGQGWLDAVVQLYAQRQWTFTTAPQRAGYSVILFGPHGGAYRHPAESVAASVRRMPQVSSLQITFERDAAMDKYAMPPGGFRLAIVNAWSLQAGQAARAELAAAFGVPVP